MAKKNKDTIIVPAVGAMTKSIIGDLCKEDKYKSATQEIKEEIIKCNGESGFHIESFLSNVEEKKEIIGEGTLNNLTEEDFVELSKKIQIMIHDLVSVHINFSDEDYKNMIHNDFSCWIAQAERKSGIEIFTTNYDYLFEMGLERNDVPYYDGFTGSYHRFCKRGRSKRPFIQHFGKRKSKQAETV